MSRQYWAAGCHVNVGYCCKNRSQTTMRSLNESHDIWRAASSENRACRSTFRIERYSRIAGVSSGPKAPRRRPASSSTNALPSDELRSKPCRCSNARSESAEPSWPPALKRSCPTLSLSNWFVRLSDGDIGGAEREEERVPARGGPVCPELLLRAGELLIEVRQVTPNGVEEGPRDRRDDCSGARCRRHLRADIRTGWRNISRRLSSACRDDCEC